MKLSDRRAYWYFLLGGAVVILALGVRPAFFGYAQGYFLIVTGVSLVIASLRQLVRIHRERTAEVDHEGQVQSEG